MPEGCYLVNCTGIDGQERSGVAFYESFLFDGGNDNHQPDAFVYTNLHGFTDWEGAEQKVVFPSGVTFTWNIDKNGSGDPEGTRCGSADNGFKTWSCFRDTDNFMFNNADNFSCAKIYNVN